MALTCSARRARARYSASSSGLSRPRSLTTLALFECGNAAARRPYRTDVDDPPLSAGRRQDAGESTRSGLLQKM